MSRKIDFVFNKCDLGTEEIGQIILYNPRNEDNIPESGAGYYKAIEKGNECANYLKNRKNIAVLNKKVVQKQNCECVSSTYLQGCLRGTRKTKAVRRKSKRTAKTNAGARRHLQIIKLFFKTWR